MVKIRDSPIPLRMMPFMVRHARLGQAAARADKTVDAFAGAIVPLNVEGTQFREELQIRMG